MSAIKSASIDCCKDECADKARIDAIVKKYEAMIADARGKGHTVAADNLEHWLRGTGTPQNPSSPWLRDFSAVAEAERVNQRRFETTLGQQADTLSDGETRTFSDYWDRQLTAGITTELYYASGTSTLTSTGQFTLSRHGDTVTITGEVSHRWHDPYDWHADLGAFIPGFGRIPDSDALLVQKCRGAKAFTMESNWKQTLKGTVKKVNWWPDSVDFNWKGP